MTTQQLNRPPAPSPGGAKLVIVALVLALVAVIATNLYIDFVRRQVAQSSFEVYVLTRSVLPGDKLRSSDVRAIRVPESFRSAFDGLGLMNEMEWSTRRDRDSVQRTASQGELLRFDLYNRPAGSIDEKNITAGKRLKTLAVNSRNVPGGLLPGMFVDIEAAFDTGRAIPEVLTVMERIKVMAVGSRTLAEEGDAAGRSRASGSFQAITIEVSPEEATNLEMVERLAVGGIFEILVRHPDDRDLRYKTPGINPQVLQILDRLRKESAITAGKP